MNTFLFSIFLFFKKPFSPIFQHCNYFHSACFRLCKDTSTNDERVSCSQRCVQKRAVKNPYRRSVKRHRKAPRVKRFQVLPSCPCFCPTITLHNDIFCTSLPVLFSFWHRTSQTVCKFYVRSSGKCNSNYFCRV